MSSDATAKNDAAAVDAAEVKLLATDFSTVAGFTSTTTPRSETLVIETGCEADVQTVYDRYKTSVQEYNQKQSALEFLESSAFTNTCTGYW